MTLLELSRTILLVNRRPVSKVRLARVIYFVHKELIRKKYMAPEDIAYVRSPLGPVPAEYPSLSDARDIVTQHNDSSALSYTNDEYTLDPSGQETKLLEQYRDVLKVVENTLSILSLWSTPQLVALSHREPSWQDHPNGSSYYISPADLKVTFPLTAPIRVKIRLRGRIIQNKAGTMQANLLRGMLADIVRESTDLEYPDEAPSAHPDAPAAGNPAPATPKSSKSPQKPEQKPNANREGSRE